MLVIYRVSIELVRELQPLVRRLRATDRALADHLDRSSMAVALHIAEADGLRGGMRRHRHTTALGEAREVSACLDVGDAKGHVVPDSARKQLDHIIGVLVKLTR